MKFKYFLVLICCLFVAIPVHAATLTGKVVALDPGHMEPSSTTCDKGAQNTIGTTTIYESDVNWQVVAETKAKLESLGATVAVLRGEHECIDRSTRYQRAADAGATVLISVHHNASSDPTVNYTITYFTQKSDQRIAQLAQQNLVASLGFEDRGISRSGFGITVKPKMPSALTEAWFLSNDSLLETRYLPEFQSAIWTGTYWDFAQGSLVDQEATALTNALTTYLTTR